MTLTKYDQITEITDRSFTVKTTVGGCRLPAFRDVAELEAHRTAWRNDKAKASTPHQSFNSEIAQLTAYKLWQAHLETTGETL